MTPTVIHNSAKRPRNDLPQGLHETQSQRLDQWLYRARFFKTRNLATAVIKSKIVRIARDGTSWRVTKPGFQVRSGDIVSFMKGNFLCSIEITAFATYRGPYDEARYLYTDHSSETNNAADLPPSITPAPRKGRPTSKDRRALMNLKTGGL